MEVTDSASLRQVRGRPCSQYETSPVGTGVRLCILHNVNARPSVRLRVSLGEWADKFWSWPCHASFNFRLGRTRWTVRLNEKLLACLRIVASLFCTCAISVTTHLPVVMRSRLRQAKLCALYILSHTSIFKTLWLLHVSPDLTKDPRFCTQIFFKFGISCVCQHLWTQSNSGQNMIQITDTLLEDRRFCITGLVTDIIVVVTMVTFLPKVTSVPMLGMVTRILQECLILRT